MNRRADWDAYPERQEEKELQKETQRIERQVERQRSQVEETSWDVQWVCLRYRANLHRGNDEVPLGGSTSQGSSGKAGLPEVKVSASRKYTEGGFRQAAGLDYREGKIQAALDAKGPRFLADLRKRQDDFEGKIAAGLGDRDYAKKIEEAVKKHLEENNLLDGETGSGNEQITLLTAVTSAVCTSDDTLSLRNTLLFDEQQDEFSVKVDWDGERGQCLIKAMRNAWGYHRVTNRKGSKLIMDDKFLQERCHIYDLYGGCAVDQACKLAKLIRDEENIHCPYAFLDANRDVIAQSEVYDQKEKSAKYETSPLYGVVYNGHITEIKGKNGRKSLSQRLMEARKKIKSSFSEQGKQTVKDGENDDAEEEMEEEYICIDEHNYDFEEIVRRILWYNSIREKKTRFVLCNGTYTQYPGMLEVDLKKSLIKETLYFVLLYIVQLTKSIPSVQTKTSSRSKRCTIEKITFPNTGNQITIYDEDHLRADICKKLNITYKNQTKTSIAKEYLEKCKERFIHCKSVMTKDLLEILETTKKPEIFYGLLHDVEEIKTLETVAYDIPKCYRNAWRTMPYDYPVFSIFDKKQPYDPVTSKNATVPGWYFIETQNVLPLGKGGQMSNVSVQFAKQKNITFEIKSMILASWSLPHDYFSQVIDDVVEKVGDKDAKHPMNDLIGLLGTSTNSKHFRTLFFQKEKEAVYYCCKFRKGGFKSSVARLFSQKEHAVDLYQVTKYKESETYESHKPIRKQIIEWANCLLHNMIEDLLGGSFDFDKILAVKTDCVFLNKQHVTKDETILNKYRKEVFPLVLKSRLEVPSKAYNPRDEPQWNERHLEGTVTAADVLSTCLGGARIQGEAGTGKSRLFMALAKTLEEKGFKVLTAAPTNLAALNVQGQTIHRGLKITGIDTGHLVTTLTHQKPDYLLIDEDSQISSQVWNIIYLWKKAGAKVLILGDGDIWKD
ncbi:hypothetical protein HDV00_009635 [Rhizophlyctis rosea]|nr:hypothetical protein HDV00_009635 [Rhizophlyctis rosea]